MASSSKPAKRKLDHQEPVSPPPLKRRVQSTTTTTAVTSFFTPTSKKVQVLEKLSWQERAADDTAPKTLLVGKYIPASKDDGSIDIDSKRKVAAFDFDSTLIQTASGKKFASDAQDWKWWHASIPTMLKKLYQEGYHIVVVSNQGGLSLKPDPKGPKSKLGTFKTKASAVLSQLDLPITLYAATEKDIFRKPRTGMWTEILQDLDLQNPDDVDLESSIFVGDAAGRVAVNKTPKDFSCSDRNFAENVGIKFCTPEEYFLGEAPREFTRFDPSVYLEDPSPGQYTKQNDVDIVLLCGSPGAGKSTFYWKQLEPLGYIRINQDTLKTREKCFKVADQHLSNRQSVAIDNTNADVEVRSKWVALAAKHSIPIRCVLFTASPEVCEHNNAVRALNKNMNPESRTILPGMAFRSFLTRYSKPEANEFQDMTEVSFKFSGNEAERKIWSRHWT